jgi:hypothetical protein
LKEQIVVLALYYVLCIRWKMSMKKGGKVRIVRLYSYCTVTKENEWDKAESWLLLFSFFVWFLGARTCLSIEVMFAGLGSSRWSGPVWIREENEAKRKCMQANEEQPCVTHIGLLCPRKPSRHDRCDVRDA